MGVRKCCTLFMRFHQAGVGGPIRSQPSGQRLIDPPEPGGKKEYFREIPEPFQPRKGSLLIIPSYRIFGSEELSSLAPSIRQRIDEPSITVNPDEMAQLEIREDGTAEVVFSKISYYLPVRPNSAVPKGVALVTAGLDEVRWDGIPVWQKLVHTLP